MCAAHEASERIFAYLSDVHRVVPNFETSNGVISFSTGPSANHGRSLMQFFTIHADQLVYLLKQICSQVVVNFQRHQHDLIRVYFASHLAAPIGFRKDTTANESGGDDDEVDLSIDEDDQIAYEDSLFAIGQFSSASPERDTLGNVVGMLAGLLEQRVCALLQPGNEANPSFALLEDIHWLLLFIGHVLVSGPSKIDTNRATQSSWDANFSVGRSFRTYCFLSQVPSAIWCVGEKSFTEEQYENSRVYLMKAMDNSPWEDNALVPPILR